MSNLDDLLNDLNSELENNKGASNASSKRTSTVSTADFDIDKYLDQMGSSRNSTAPPSNAVSARQSATVNLDDLNDLLGQPAGTRASSASISSVNMDEIDKLLSGERQMSSQAGSMVSMAEIDALLAEQSNAKTPEERQRVSLLLSQRVSVLRERASTRNMNQVGGHLAPPGAAAAPKQQPTADSRTRHSTASQVSLDEIDALLAESGASSRPVSVAINKPAAQPRQQQSRPVSSASVSMDEIDALLAESGPPASRPVSTALQQPQRGGGGQSRPVSSAVSVVSMDEIDALLAADNAMPPQRGGGPQLMVTPPSRPVSTAHLSLSEVDQLLEHTAPPKLAGVRDPQGPRPSQTATEAFMDAFGVESAGDQASRPASTAFSPRQEAELDKILAPKGGKAAAKAAAKPAAQPAAPTASFQAQQRKGYEEVSRAELDDLLGPDPGSKARTIYDVPKDAKKLASDLQEERKQRSNSLKLSPEELEAERESERLAREDAEKARHETPEETMLRRKFEEMKRRDDLLIAKAQAAEREERRRRAELQAKVEEEKAKARASMQQSSGGQANTTKSRETSALLEPKLYTNSQADLEAKQKRMEEEERKRRQMDEQKYKDHMERRRLQMAEQILADEGGTSVLQFGEQKSYFRWNITFKDILVKERLGVGEFGSVYRGFYKEQQVAVKKLRTPALTEELLSAVRNEVKQLAVLSHPSLVIFLGLSTSDQDLYTVCEYITGAPLYGMLRNKAMNDSFDNETVLRYSRTLAEALAYLHANQVIHRALKTKNIIVDRQGRLKIRDHGLLAVKDFCLTQGDSTSPEYCSPELLARRPVDDRTDVYSFGMVLIELFARESIYPRDMDPTAIINGVLTEGLRPQIPVDTPFVFIKLIESCWQTDPALRPAFEKVTKILSQPPEKIFGYQPKV